MTKVLLTGASGYIGKHITLQLLAAGYDVRASVRTSAKAEEVRAAVAPHLGSADALDRLSFVELDLNDDAGWWEALQGCDVLVHTASPFVIDAPKDPEELVRPAVDGTLRALRAAKAAGVTRVVLTSSTVAIWGSPLGDGPAGFNETMWTDLDSPLGREPYNRSKTLAEWAAWDFVATEAPDMRLTTINPGVVLGAPLDRHFGTSVSIIERLLLAKDPALPDLSFPIVDVRDVARLHVAAITRPASEGRRFIASGGTRSFLAIARVIKKALPDRRIVTRRAPSFLVRLLALTDRSIRGTLPVLGKAMIFDASAAVEVFETPFINPDESVRETALFLVERSGSR